MLSRFRKSSIKKLNALVAFLFLAVAVTFTIGITSSAKNMETFMKPTMVFASGIEQLTDSIHMYQDSIVTVKTLLTDEVARYMRSVYPKTKMSPDYIVELCVDRDFDIPLLLSQAHQESHFGKRTGGTNSCFGVVNKRYSHVDESVLGYVDLMQRRYVRTRTPEQCIKSGFRVEGSRTAKYASDPSYPQTIGRIRSNIIRKTEISRFHNRLRELQFGLDSLLKKRLDYDQNRRFDIKENYRSKDTLDSRLLCRA